MTNNERNAHMEIWASREADEPHKCPECGSEMLEPIEPGQNFYWCLVCGYEEKVNHVH